ncbi:MAG: cysteine--tRNA ligase [Candidatus Cryosericum sp.]
MKIHDTMSGKVVDIEPRDPGQIGMYVCGVTPYAPAHIGHARTAVVYDLLKRYLQFAGYNVTHVSNYTDVDDKIIAQAHAEGVDPLELSARYIEEYRQDMEQLNVLPPDRTPRVSESIADIQKLIEQILAGGYGYESSDGVYFSVRKFPSYGKLSGRSIDELRSGARVEVNEAKQDPLDFALWKFAKPGEISWDSPWGKGRPGWHIECSAMSLRELGPGFDIHGGGEDLIFPHHENEIAQSEAALGGKQFVRYWMHSGMVNMGAEKMSKSLGNVVTIHDLLRQYPGQVLRLYLLQTSYQKPLKFSVTGIDQAFAAYERLVEFQTFVSELPTSVAGAAGGLAEDCSAFLEEFDGALADNLNTSRALAAVYAFMSKVRRTVSEQTGAQLDMSCVQRTFETAMRVLGLDQGRAYLEHKRELLRGMREVIASVAEDFGVEVPEGSSAEDLLKQIMDRRRAARAHGDYEDADRIRERLGAVGIALEDSVDGVRYRISAKQ